MTRQPVCLSRAGSAALIVASALQLASGQQVAQQPAERAAPLLTISFAAVRGDGTPAADLRAEDVSIKIDGKPREIPSLQLVSMAGGHAAADMPPLPPPFGSNAVTTRGRNIQLFVDDESFVVGGEQMLRRSA